MKIKTLSVIGERLGRQIKIKLDDVTSVFCLTETKPNPTTLVADLACALI